MYELLLVIVVQVCLEALPVSSSGHLSLLLKYWFSSSVTLLGVPKFLDHLLHGPMALVLMIFFFNQWWPLLKRGVRSLVTLHCRWSQKKLLGLLKNILWWVFLCDVITILFYQVREGVFYFFPFLLSDVGLLFGFCVTACLLGSLYFLEREPVFQPSVHAQCPGGDGLPLPPQMAPATLFKREVSSSLTTQKALLVGICQGIAFLPGISRFGITYVVCRHLGMSPRRSLQFSFLIFFPLVILAFFVKGLLHLFKNPADASMFSPFILSVIFISTLVCFVLFYVAWWLCEQKKLWWLGLYMLLPIAATIGLVLF